MVDKCSVTNKSFVHIAVGFAKTSLKNFFNGMCILHNDSLSATLCVEYSIVS